MLSNAKDMAKSILKSKAAPVEEEVVEEESADPGMEQAMQEFLDAISAKDPAAMSEALKSAFALLEMQPHEEAGTPAEEP